MHTPPHLRPPWPAALRSRRRPSSAGRSQPELLDFAAGHGALRPGPAAQAAAARWPAAEARACARASHRAANGPEDVADAVARSSVQNWAASAAAAAVAAAAPPGPCLAATG
eukprot:4599989-Prymnesium_polylepis.2